MSSDRSTFAIGADDAWFALSEINHSVRFADAKASVLLAVGGVIGGIGLSQATAIGDLTTVPGFCWSTAMIAVALSSLLSLRALLPRLRVTGRVSTSMVYFDHIARRFAGSQDEYVARFAQIAEDVDAMRREIAGQIWANSVVARRKFRDVAIATWLLGIGLVSCGVAVYLEQF